MIKDIFHMLFTWATLYLACNALVMIFGLFDDGVECRVFRNYEYVLPGKQIGCWLVKPVEEIEE